MRSSTVAPATHDWVSLMRRCLFTLVAVSAAFAALAMTAGSARADGWYYSWSCASDRTNTGGCAVAIDCVVHTGCDPHGLGAASVGPFGTESDCVTARLDDVHASGPNVDFGYCSCVGCGSPPPPPPPPSPSLPGGGGYAGGYSSGSSSPAQPSRLAKIVFALSVGPGWSATDGTGVSTSTASAGLDLEFHTGKDAIGGLFGFGFHGAQISSPALGPDGHFYGAVPLLIGLRADPRIVRGKDWHVRLSMAATIGAYAQVVCSGCSDVMDDVFGFAWSLRGGLQYYFSRTAKEGATGISLEVTYGSWSSTDDTSGLKVESPPWMLRLSLLGMVGKLMNNDNR
jgi:hypothetical protein